MTQAIHPEMQVLVDAAARRAPGGSIAEQRAAWSAYARETARPYPGGMQVTDRTVQTPNAAVPVRAYRPADLPRPAPAILYMHGGGMMKGDLDSSDTVAWGLAEGCRAAVISVDYRLAPENPYPAAFQDCYGVLERLAEDPDALDLVDLRIDGARIAVCGDSAGGCLAAAVALAARDRGGPAVAAQALIYPMLGIDLTLPSYRENGNGPGLTAASMRNYWTWYLPEGIEAAEAYAAPLQAAVYANLPPAFVHTAELDPLRDDGALYAERLRAAGTPVIYRCADGMIHGFLRARFEGPAAAAEFGAICDFLRQHLGT